MTVRILLFGTLAFDLGIANASCQEAPTFIYSLRVCNADGKRRFIYLFIFVDGPGETAAGNQYITLLCQICLRTS